MKTQTNPDELNKTLHRVDELAPSTRVSLDMFKRLPRRANPLFADVARLPTLLFRGGAR